MSANFCGDNALAGIRSGERNPASRQSIEVVEVMSSPGEENSGCGESSLAPVALNYKPDSDVQTSAPEFADSISSKSSCVNELGRVDAYACGESAGTKCEKSVRMQTLVRWLKFNFVGGIGIIVQFIALFLMKSVFHLNYLAATALAVEAAVVHNFVWHERYTWADRVQPSWRGSLMRLARFNLTTGGVSIVGNLALMKVMVGAGHMNYLVANGIAIALCSLANFLVSEEWVFDQRSADTVSSPESCGTDFR